MGGGLAVYDVIEVITKAVEWRDLGGEHLVETGAFGLTIGLDGFGGEGGFGLEKVIEAAFADAGLEADGIDGGGAVAVFPDEGTGGFHEAEFGVADPGHGERLEVVD
jgi:hypothetical protein